MIKGVHRQMIEVTHTGSPYFERAFLVMRCGEPPEQDKLHSLAQKVVEQAGTYAGLRRQRWRQWLRQGLFLAWRIPGMAEPGGLPSMGSHRVGHD